MTLEAANVSQGAGTPKGRVPLAGKTGSGASRARGRRRAGCLQGQRRPGRPSTPHPADVVQPCARPTYTGFLCLSPRRLILRSPHPGPGARRLLAVNPGQTFRFIAAPRPYIPGGWHRLRQHLPCPGLPHQPVLPWATGDRLRSYGDWWRPPNRSPCEFPPPLAPSTPEPFRRVSQRLPARSAAGDAA